MPRLLFAPLLAAAVVAAVVAAGCAASPAARSAEEGGPLDALPTCESAPPASSEDVAGLEFPDGAIVTKVQRGDPLVTVQGYVAQTPVEVRRYYQSRDDLKLFEIEDEIFEAEALLGNGTHRSYVKARAICAQGSQLFAVVAPEVDAQGLPLPAGGARATPTPAP